MKFNEDSRVKIPTLLHLIRLGYDYISLSKSKWDEDTNIFTDIFYNKIKELNPELSDEDVSRLYSELSLSLENEDLGKVFYEKLTSKSGVKLIDFEDFDRNQFNVVTELPCKKDDEEFRPDITILVNGLPLVFIEVKKPNNREGIIAEHKRIHKRFQNKKFRKFINITQLMIFSNNMEYDDTTPQTIQGAFYSTTSYEKPPFNYFREEENFNLEEVLKNVTDDEENFVLKDTNLVGIKNSPEFVTNKSPDKPTNRICTSLLKKDRLAFILQYAIAYVKEASGLQKHVMRYPQMFAVKEIEKRIEEGEDKGIIWHTQGSGKTALSYYSVGYLRDYFSKKGIVPKFYFIVDRLDLLNQASKEFRKRSLRVHNIDSKEDFAKDIKSNEAVHNDDGKSEITVVNIHKFKDDPSVVKNEDYNLKIQRIFFLDEAHRSYDPKGSFLANLMLADNSSVKIALTGTPLLGKEVNSRKIWGPYFHKYYYNLSIKDGYTLRLLREPIEKGYVLKLKKTLEQIRVLEKNIKNKQVYSHPSYVSPMLEYIVEDLSMTKVKLNDNSIGAMVVCDSSEQAKEMFKIFNEKYNEKDGRVTTSKLILHDIGTKQEREGYVEDFKDGKIDLLFVYNMLLTGFDAPRLKKLYLGRVVKSHNLLQTLTRVNRTYKDFRYGYVVDFADIKREFDKTNRAYFDELQSELGDEMEHYSNLFKSQEEIEEEIDEIKRVLFQFDTTNAETFSEQINQISDRKEMLKITKVLNNAKSLYNLIRLSGDTELLDKLDFKKLTILAREANNHLAMINAKEALEKNVDTTNLLNIALEDVIFTFAKVKEEELVLADQLKDILQKTREGLAGNFDQKDPEFVSLKEELERLFKKKNLNEVTKEEMEKNIQELEKIYSEAKELERKNQLLRAKYENDEKYARLHKRLMEKQILTKDEVKLFEALHSLKTEVDSKILQNSSMLDNEGFIQRMIQKLVISQFKGRFDLDAAKSRAINNMIVKEYLDEYNGRIE
ncbi:MULTISPECIES: type I restriction endonuclease subunit R [unclassified Halobacteriovorax]|uniref:type I restriction endonuclease subunit R n=1 Tax=unclassified Halobacteriovorax TaxID=2639665 RepID=UPI00399AE64A